MIIDFMIVYCAGARIVYLTFKLRMMTCMIYIVSLLKCSQEYHENNVFCVTGASDTALGV